ncbi:alcohol dehydrogenase catalytic domain-containing protein [Micromonospora sp. BRA006-A]|nr:alcohol dehydrogenase catalytic domain-containing protein [Micromonospora sp. BRA006-A]
MIRRLVAGRTGEPADVLSVAELPDDPPPGPGEVRLAVRTVGLNFLDVMLCRGEAPVRPDPPMTPGVETAGRVVAAGAGAEHLLGQEVLACPRCRAARSARQSPWTPRWWCRDRPQSIRSPRRRCPSPTRPRGSRSNDPVSPPGRRCWCTRAPAGWASPRSSSPSPAARGSWPPRAVRPRPRSAAITAPWWRSTTADDFVPAVRAATGGRGVDVVVDPVGGDVFGRSWECLAFEAAWWRWARPVARRRRWTRCG